MSISFSAINENETREVTFADGQTQSFPEFVDLPEEFEFFSMSNDNAMAIFGLLGIEWDCCGTISIPEARRAVIRAKATFERRAPEFTEEEIHLPGGHAGTRVVREGSGVTRIERMGAEFHSFARDEDYLSRRVSDFADLVEAAANAGATGLSWG
jgi:hypothetical protein